MTPLNALTVEVSFPLDAAGASNACAELAEYAEVICAGALDLAAAVLPAPPGYFGN